MIFFNIILKWKIKIYEIKMLNFNQFIKKIYTTYNT